MDRLAFLAMEPMFMTSVRYEYFKLSIYLQNSHVTTDADSLPLFSIPNINTHNNSLFDCQLHQKNKIIGITYHSFYTDFCENNVVPTYAPCYIQHLPLDNTNDPFISSDLSFACVILSHQLSHQSMLIMPYM